MSTSFSKKDLQSIKKRISKVVRADPTIIDDLASEVVLKCIQGGWLPSQNLIRNICIDYLRHQLVTEKAQEHYARYREKDPFDEEGTSSVIQLLESTELTKEEQKAIWSVFWNNEAESSHRAIQTALIKLLIQSRKDRK